MEQVYTSCQSCGMPFKDDPKGGGTNTDGSLSKTYCSYCYQAGAFTQPGFTVEQMQEFVKGKLREIGWFHRLMAPVFIRSIPKLERWKK